MVLLTPGKCAARWICFAGRVRQRRRPQPEPGDAGGPPLQQQVGDLGRGADGEVRVVAGPGGPGARVEAFPAVPGGACRVVQQHREVREDVHGLAVPSGLLLRAADEPDQPGRVVRVARGDVHDVGDAGPPSDRGLAVGQDGDDGLALRWARGDRGSPDGEPVAAEVDVVELVAIDEASGGGVPDLRVVLPAVPQPALHLDVVGGLGEQVRDEPGGVGPLQVGRRDRREGAASEERGLVRPGRRPDPDAGPARADVVEGGDGLGDVEGLGVRRHHGRHQADVPGERCDPGRYQDGVEPAADEVGAVVGLVRGGRLPRQAVLDGHQVQQAPLGLDHQVAPVAGGEQLGRPGVDGSPGRRVPPGAVQRDGEVEGNRWGHPVSLASGSGGCPLTQPELSTMH